MENNFSKSTIKSLYFNDQISPKSHSNFKIQLSKLKDSLQSELPSIIHNKSNLLSKIYSNSKLDDCLFYSENESYKNQSQMFEKKQKSRYIHIPVYLPSIIRNKSITDSKITIQFFDKTSDEHHSRRERSNFLALSKEDGLKIAKNEYLLNLKFYQSRKKNKQKENSSKMLIKELWNKSYHKKVLEMSGIRHRQEEVENNKYRSYTKRAQELEEYFFEPKDGYMRFLAEKDKEKKISVLINSSENHEERAERHFKKNKGTDSLLYKGEIKDLLNQCKEFNNDMKVDKKIFNNELYGLQNPNNIKKKPNFFL